MACSLGVEAVASAFLSRTLEEFVSGVFRYIRSRSRCGVLPNELHYRGTPICQPTRLALDVETNCLPDREVLHLNHFAVGHPPDSTRTLITLICSVDTNKASDFVGFDAFDSTCY